MALKIEGNILSLSPYSFVNTDGQQVEGTSAKVAILNSDNNQYDIIEGTIPEVFTDSHIKTFFEKPLAKVDVECLLTKRGVLKVANVKLAK